MNELKDSKEMKGLNEGHIQLIEDIITFDKFYEVLWDY